MAANINCVFYPFVGSVSPPPRLFSNCLLRLFYNLLCFNFLHNMYICWCVMVNFSLFKLLIFCSIGMEIYFLLPRKYFAFTIDPENPFCWTFPPISLTLCIMRICAAAGPISIGHISHKSGSATFPRWQFLNFNAPTPPLEFVLISHHNILALRKGIKIVPKIFPKTSQLCKEICTRVRHNRCKWFYFDRNMETG